MYIYLIAMMRIFARRTMAQLNPIDLMIILMLGSSVETAMVHGSTALSAGFVSASVLLLANYAMNRVFLSNKRLRHSVGGGPILLVHDGKFIDFNMKRIGFTTDDVRAALRQRECGEIEDVRSAVLEPDGTINVVFLDEPEDSSD